MRDQMLKLANAIWINERECNGLMTGEGALMNKAVAVEYLYIVVRVDSWIYNTMVKMAMKDKNTENSKETIAAALRRLWSYGSHLIWIHAVKHVSFSFLFGVQNAIEFFLFYNFIFWVWTFFFFEVNNLA